jgi:hypothetical protein
VTDEALAPTSGGDAPHWRVPLIAASVWGVNWLLLRASGWPYSLRTLYAGWQFLPVDAVREEFVTSIVHLHTQPPGWNLVVGAIAKWSPFGVSASHQLLTLALGMLLAAAVASTLRRLGASVAATLVLTAVATMNAQVMGNASAPRYDLAVAALLAVLVWSVGRLAAPYFKPLLLTVAVGTALVMTRSLYHPLWLLVTLAALWWLERPGLSHRQLAVVVLVPMLAIGGWIVKNEVVFGRATMSSWTGMNMLRAVEPAVDPDRIAELVADGTLSGVAEVGHFRRYEAYAPVMPPCSPPSDAPLAVGQAYRPIPDEVRVALDPDQTPNFNYECYLPVYEQAGDDALALMRAEPRAWLTARAWAANNWFQVAPPLEADESGVWDAERHLSRVVLLGVPHPGMPEAWSDDSIWAHRGPVSLTLIVATAALLVGTVASIRRKAPLARQAVFTTAAIATLWTALAGITFELGEQERFRSATDPLVLAFGGLLIWEWVRGLLRRPDQG